MTVTDYHPPVGEPPDDLLPRGTTPQRTRHARANHARVPPHDPAAEASLLGAMLLSAKACDAALERGLRAEAFYRPQHATIYAAIISIHSRGQPADPVTVADELRRDGTLDQVGGPTHLIQLQTGTPAISNAARYAAIVDEHARLRRLIQVAGELADIGYSMPDDVNRAETAALDLVTRVQPRAAQPDQYLDLDEFLDVDDPDYLWAIPGLLEQADRCIVTATAGTGKSTLLRQIGVMAASGLHPFTGETIDPVRVLLLDVENSARQVRRHMKPLRQSAAGRYQPDMLRLRVYGHAINLADRPTVLDLARIVDDYQPGLILGGPLYKLIAGNPTEEQTAKAVADAFDELRGICGSALILEAHSPYAAGGGKKREIRPYGASLWERWPEFGWYFDKDGQVEHWRGQREERAWPAALERSTPWPWAARQPVKADAPEWHGPTQCIDAIVRLLQGKPGEEASARTIETELRARGNGFRLTTIREAAERAAMSGRIVVRTGPRSVRLYSSSEHPQPDLGVDF